MLPSYITLPKLDSLSQTTRGPVKQLQQLHAVRPPLCCATLLYLLSNRTTTRRHRRRHRLQPVSFTIRLLSKLHSRQSLQGWAGLAARCSADAEERPTLPVLSSCEHPLAPAYMLPHGCRTLPNLRPTSRLPREQRRNPWSVAYHSTCLPFVQLVTNDLPCSKMVRYPFA
ncbi:uncharacterized protein K460DRAFT_192714 [Cucurbitaria berberidis CBS 394.84]|uniref:Uncharacterized protein n=1 Tax=Cucurbitaria berberidis CBS 394.84 TaxID=1168544 RepID=A0A9P4G863_9PLEO|nr:uncharacterized protein K460DRAFT_192714 [Cucurbitaria berberidis CBS 394.84]KAF1840811.1 hypothetical protein K460DRAFT_192714 [Cucurbitaria berberidis CBS 394.84]